jgi:hypothetical protein
MVAVIRRASSSVVRLSPTLSMAILLIALGLLSTWVYAVPSSTSLESDITILINNDLQGTQFLFPLPALLCTDYHTGSGSPLSSSGLILLSSASQSNAVARCQALGEQLWAPELGTAIIQQNLDYLVYCWNIGHV